MYNVAACTLHVYQNQFAVIDNFKGALLGNTEFASYLCFTVATTEC